METFVETIELSDFCQTIAYLSQADFAQNLSESIWAHRGGGRVPKKLDQNEGKLDHVLPRSRGG